MLNVKLYKTLKDIINEAYPEEKYPKNNFKKFYIDIISKEMKTVHGRYFPDKKLIEVFNLSRPTGHIISTTIHEASHHIDHCLRDTSDHTKEFYKIMHTMLLVAMGMGLITKNDILTANDSNDKKRLIKYFGDIENWTYKNIDYKQNIVTFKISNCYSIKNILKQRNYIYSPGEQSWIKDINKENEDEEKEFLSNIISMANVKIISGNEIEIDAIYYICVTKCYEQRAFLKENGYMWNGYNKIKNNSWNKKIFAKDKEVELAKIAHLEQQGVKIQILNKKK